MRGEQKTVFISYRRKPAWAIARLVYNDLLEHGYDPFMDIKSLGSGKFDINLLRQIETRAHFIIILTPGTLERCNDLNDPLRSEIEHAIDTERNIVPLLIYGFSFKKTQKYLTGKLDQLHLHNGWPLSQFSFEADMKIVRERFLMQPLSGTSSSVLVSDPPSMQSPPTKTELRAEEYVNSAFRKENSGNVDGAIADYTKAIRLNSQINSANEAPDVTKNLMDYAKDVEKALYEILYSTVRQTSSMSALGSHFESYTKLVELATKPLNQVLFQHSVEGLDEGLEKFAKEALEEFSILRNNWEIVKTSSIALITISQINTLEDKDALEFLKSQLGSMSIQIGVLLPSIKGYADSLGKLNEHRKNQNPAVEKVQAVLDEQYEIYFIGNTYLLRITNLIERKVLTWERL